MGLSGKVALVTGSARGIGRAIAVRLAEEGADIALNDIPQASEALNAVADEVRALNRRALAVTADVSQPQEVARMVETVLAGFGHIDILVNNAGITRDALILRMSDEDWDAVINIDLKSVFLCTRAVLRPMLKARWGRIVNIASIVGVHGNAGQANYAAAKGGVIAFTRSVAKEVASRGITVNAIAPGFIDTKMTQGLDEKQAAELLKRIPMGTVGTPRDVAEAVAFLAGEGARYITGQVLGVDGGM
ncbi:MAG: 3-oxoacyl-[acyl-carrier-protein] reductase [Dehalococcoidales bacterium]|nr:3-oxoacyl-[acyl-carrier-protein] reductase [Dehalococcoidales bacterium]